LQLPGKVSLEFDFTSSLLLQYNPALRVECTNVGQNLITNQHNSRVNICKMVRKTKLKRKSISFYLLIFRCSSLDPIVDPEPALIRVGAYDPKRCRWQFTKQVKIFSPPVVSKEYSSAVIIACHCPNLGLRSSGVKIMLNCYCSLG